MSEDFERLLVRTERQPRAPGTPCPEAGVLAAYLDVTLTSAERAAVEAHAADCARCALQIAAIVRLEDESGRPQHAPVSRWWRPALTWILPAATAALVAAVYVALPGPSSRSTPSSTTGTAAKAGVEESTAGDGHQTADSPPNRVLYEALPTDARPDVRKEAPRAAPQPPPATALSRVTPPPGSSIRARQQPVAKNAAGAAEGGTFPTERDAFTAADAEARAEAASAVAPAAPVGGEPTGAAGGVTAQRSAAGRAYETPVAVAPLIVRSPDARVQWRVGRSRIERSTDGGSSWTSERTPPFEQITIAVAPSPDVCWLASPAGQVVRRNEGGTWVDVSPPFRAGIIRIESAGPLDATVVRSDETRDRTADGGRTWEREEAR